MHVTDKHMQQLGPVLEEVVRGDKTLRGLRQLHVDINKRISTGDFMRRLLCRSQYFLQNVCLSRGIRFLPRTELGQQRSKNTDPLFDTGLAINPEAVLVPVTAPPGMG